MALSIDGPGVSFLGDSWEVPENACLIPGLPEISQDAQRGTPVDHRRDRPSFRIEPPSAAGVVTVEDQGTLEFKLRLQPAG